METSEFNKKKVYSEASGSTAIIDKRIRMQMNSFGIYEEVVLSKKNEILNPSVEYVSPNLNKEINEYDIARELYEKVKGIKYDKRLGYYTSLYAGHVEEGTYHENSSSGGMGTWILKELFEQNLIDGVIHVKENVDINGSSLFQYDISKTIEEIKAGSKTKYYPVELSSVLKEIKENSGRYAIVGIPSFIMAIRLLSKKDDIIKKRIKYTIGLICGHQKSSKFAEAMAWQVGIKPGNLKHIDFRKKLPNRPANNYGIEMTGIINGKQETIIKPTKELLGQNWGQGFFKVMASDFTDDVMNETADITLGDAWLPEYTRDSRGNNVVVVRNNIINNLIIDGIKSNRLNLDNVDKETIFRSQEGHYRHTHDELAYRLYKKDKLEEWRPTKRVKSTKRIPFFRRKIQDLREEISTKSHIVYKEAVEKDDLNYFIKTMDKLTKRYVLLYRVNEIQKRGIFGSMKVIFQKVFKR